MSSAHAIQAWEASGHAQPGAWAAAAEWLAPILFLLALVVLVARALVRGRRYRATGVLGEEDLRAVHAALAASERRTIGEILPVVLERSDPHPEAAWLAALTSALLGSVALARWLPWHVPGLLLACQIGLGALGFACARLLPDFRRLFVRAGRAREVTEEQALQEFHRHELEHTQARTGVLLFVSLLEQRAVVLADEGIAARVAPEHWTRTIELVLDGIRRSSLRAGLVSGIESAGAVLAEHFPAAEGDRNEVPDRVIVRKE